jgi:eukaryotic-like serine/threonine-protein kinase
MRERVADLLDSLLDEQKRSWLNGQRPCAVDLLQGSSLQHDSEALLDLVYNEIVVREELGEQPSLQEYIERYPHLREDLELHFEVHRAMHDELLVQTARAQDSESLLDVDMPNLELGPKIAEYEIIGHIGQGGMGVVYKARHQRLRRCVALKMFHPGRIPSPRELTRFQTEAETIARLQHPNIVQIFEVGQANGLPYLTLELAEQGTLAQKLQRLPLAPRAAAELIETLARAVQHAHEHHIIHRDLKPGNVLFALDGTPKISDFGLAKVLEGADDWPRDATQSGEPIGTPRYMAPEQAAGQPQRIGPATDVYGLGTLFYECLTGQVPFVASNVIETLDKIRNLEPVSPRRLLRSVPRDLATIALRCLQKEPSRRYASAQALADDLRRYLDGKPIQARPIRMWEHTWKWCRRRPAHAALIALIFLLLSSSLAVVAWRQRAEKERVAKVREQVHGLMKSGQTALLVDDTDLAHEQFKSAWMKVQGEPALLELRTGVAGWLDHSRRAAVQHHFKQRVPPRELDVLRDEALLQSLLLEPAVAPAQQAKSAREAIQTALELTLPDHPVLGPERERLILLDASLVLHEADAAAALARLDAVQDPQSRRYHEQRADYLERLGRADEAADQRARAAAIPADPITVLINSGIEQARRRELDKALSDFTRLLDLQPEHFTARLLQAVCLLQLERPNEALIGLTACIAQQPRFASSYVLRSRCRLQLGDREGAVRDLGRALEAVPERDREIFWCDKVMSQHDLAPLSALPQIHELARLFPGRVMPRPERNDKGI